jgi:type I restriction-modification system DNA methylase subunit
MIKSHGAQMTKDDIISAIIKDTKYHLYLFTEDEIDVLRNKVLIKETRGRKTPFINCIIRDKEIQLKPEEIVRQLYVARLTHQYGYLRKRLAFEYLVNKSAKGKKGQYFTPRHVIDMCVQRLNSKRGEYMIDKASGSCAFPVHTMFKLAGHFFSSEVIPEEEQQNVLKVFGIDFDKKTVRVARTFNLIAGDGETNVLHLNTLAFDRWSDKPEKDKKCINTYIREFIAQHGRILAVVGLDGKTFKPHTGSKTSVLFFQKWDDTLCPKVEDYPIFFAVSEKAGNDHSGDYIYLKNGNGHYRLDRNGHLIVDHDLHNHDGELPDGIAEAFNDWAKKEKLSFWE